MPDFDREQKTEQATPRRREELRRKGQVVRSQELSSALILLLGAIVMYVAQPATTAAFKNIFSACFSDYIHRSMSFEGAVLILQEVALATLGAIAPLFAGIFVVAAVSSYGQVGFMVSGEALQLKFERLDPVKGMKRLLSLKSVVKLATSLLKVAIVGVVAWFYINHRLDDIPPLVHYSVGAIFESICRWSFELVLVIAAAFLVIAAFDYAFQRWDFERDIRMTKEELREELKRSEGDPLVRGRVRQIQREMASRRMMQDVPTADVVVKNPTHYAVALRYEPTTKAAPVVVAKGMNLIAQKILDLAREHNVPEVENKPLAQTLYKTVDVGKEIPPELYRAVAEVLAYVYKLRRQTAKA